MLTNMMVQVTSSVLMETEAVRDKILDKEAKQDEEWEGKLTNISKFLLDNYEDVKLDIFVPNEEELATKIDIVLQVFMPVFKHLTTSNKDTKKALQCSKILDDFVDKLVKSKLCVCLGSFVKNGYKVGYNHKRSTSGHDMQKYIDKMLKDAFFEFYRDPDIYNEQENIHIVDTRSMVYNVQALYPVINGINTLINNGILLPEVWKLVTCPLVMDFIYKVEALNTYYKINLDTSVYKYPDYTTNRFEGVERVKYTVINDDDPFVSGGMYASDAYIDIKLHADVFKLLLDKNNDAARDKCKYLVSQSLDATRKDLQVDDTPELNSYKLLLEYVQKQIPKKAVQGGGKATPQPKKTDIKKHILGRTRTVYMLGRKQYIMYKKQFISLREAQALAKNKRA